MENHLLYTTGCPKCRILEKKLADKNVAFETCSDPNKIRDLGIMSVPVLKCPDGKMLQYFDAVKYVNGL